MKGVVRGVRETLKNSVKLGLLADDVRGGGEGSGAGSGAQPVIRFIFLW